MKNSKKQIAYQTDSNGKKILTKEVVENALDEICKSFNRGTILSMIVAVFGISVGLTFILMAGFIGLIFLIPGVIFLYMGIKNKKTSQKHKENILKGNYRIIKTFCSEYIDHSDDYEVGANAKHTHKFAYAPKQRLELPYCFAQEGNIVYLVYLDNHDKIGAYFNEREFTLSSNLIIE